MEAGVIEMLFSFGVVLALAFWQLWTVWPRGEKPDRNKTPDDPES